MAQPVQCAICIDCYTTAAVVANRAFMEVNLPDHFMEWMDRQWIGIAVCPHCQQDMGLFPLPNIPRDDLFWMAAGFKKWEMQPIRGIGDVGPYSVPRAGISSWDLRN